MELRGKTALVTGGAVRVGRSIALAFAERGARVAITYRSSEEAARETVAALQALGVEAMANRCDQSDPPQISASISAIESELGPIDVLVNNASQFDRTPVETVTLEQWEAMQAVNLRGPWLFMQALGPAMQTRGEGVILNMLDIAVERPYVEHLPYCAAKAGLAALTRGLARALAPQVRVCGIAPGAVEWPDDYPEASRQAYLRRTPLGRVGSAEDVAATAVFLIEGSDYLTGITVPVDGGRSLT
jgi:NAD(P)-dependent dehydrogenase (short-subunit alcohol dehydrogenase family)